QAFESATGKLRQTWMRKTRDGEREDGLPAFAFEAREGLRVAASELGNAPAAVGLASPGIADPGCRKIKFMPGRLEGLEGLVWGDLFEMPDQVSVLNDGHAALLGEVWQGAAQGCENVSMLTLGTGVGGAILAHGRLLRGHIGRAGHLGHMTVDFEGSPDIANTPGSIEDAIGAAGLEGRGEGKYEDYVALLESVKAEDPHAVALWDRSIKALAATLASIINVLDPEKILIGGGVVNAGAALFDPLNRYLDGMEWRPNDHRVAIVPAALGENAGSYGAARFAQDPTRFS
ncbi:MAG: ROK family protein, partial [Verrucomicrobiota bacterium]